MVKRPRLTTWLDQRRGRPLTLISAPAGYGKSTLITCWLEQVDCLNAWISLDEHDNELGSFLGYFLAAILTIFPNAMPESRALVMATPLPARRWPKKWAPSRRKPTAGHHPMCLARASGMVATFCYAL
jgi:hypothetical protein